MAVQWIQPSRFATGAFSPEADITWHSLFWAEGTAFEALGLADTDAVTTWPNETTEADATRTATTVIYDASHASFNNQPVVDISAGGYLSFTPTGDPTQPTSVVTVCRWGSLTSAHIVVSDASANIRYYADTTKWWMSNGVSEPSSTSASNTNAHLMVGLFSSTANERLWVDGTSEIDSATGSAGFAGAINIGAGAGGLFKFVGQIALMGFYQGDFTSDASYADFTAWCESHYGLTIA